ncbi:MAG: GTP-binding protein [Candidatus Thorarchaeota archaeon]
MSHIYKKFVTERVVDLINDTSAIRNCTVIAHIDHGKTTLTDSLIAASGLLSKEVAAKARLLDYDLIEQERGITIKASGISLVHDYEGKTHLIHLIDTPGHIDFSSHVTRGLRLTDGAIIVVDAIEGLMVQTETVSRQAMKELVRPVLFVNKVDRLINERKLDFKKVAFEVTKTVREFNAMLGKYLDDDLLEEWEVSFLNGSLCIGSALHKWGIGISTLKERADGKLKPSALAQALMDILEEIVAIYLKDEGKKLSELYPIADVLLDAVVRTIPNPIIAQEYRVPSFWEGDIESSIAKGIMSCDKESPSLVLVGDVQPDRHASAVAAVRIFSGQLVRGKPLLNLRTGKSGKPLQIGLYMSKSRVALDNIPAGNLAFVTGIKDLLVGDTLVEESIADISPMKGLEYPTELVVTYTVEPRNLAELAEVQEALTEFVKTDPALEFETNPETGEMLLSGAGELHVEVSVEKLTRRGVKIILGKPMVLIKEQMTLDGEACESGEKPSSTFRVKAIPLLDDADVSSFGSIIDSDLQSQCYLIDASDSINPLDENAEWMKEAFTAVIRSGPVRGERMRMLAVIIQKATIRLESPENSWRDITQPLVNSMRESILSGKPIVLEPWVRLELSTPEDHVGILTSIVARRRGHILEIDSERSLFRIVAEIPVSASFGLANEIRTATSGWATWGAKAGEYRELGSSG